MKRGWPQSPIFTTPVHSCLLEAAALGSVIRYTIKSQIPSRAVASSLSALKRGIWSEIKSFLRWDQRDYSEAFLFVDSVNAVKELDHFSIQSSIKALFFHLSKIKKMKTKKHYKPQGKVATRQAPACFF